MINPLTATPTLNFIGLPREYIYPRVEDNRRYIGHYKSVASQAVSITLPEGCSSGFVHWLPAWYLLQPRIFTQVPKHGTPRLKYGLVAYHYSPVGGHTGKLRHTTILQATVRLQGYPQTKTYRFTQVTAFTASGSGRIIW